MAQSLTSSSAHLRGSIDFPTFGTASTVGIWIKPNWSSGDSTTHVFWGYSENTSQFVVFYKHANNNIYAGWESGSFPSTPLIHADTGLFEAGVWAHHAVAWDDTADLNYQAYYKNGVFVASSSVGFSLGINAGLTIGNYPSNYGGGAAANMDGTVAEFAVWTRILADDELLALAAGFSPLLMKQSLNCYYPLRGVDGLMTTEINRVRVTSSANPLALTVTNASNADHPPILYPAPPFAFGFSGDPGPGPGGGSDSLYPSWQSVVVR